MLEAARQDSMHTLRTTPQNKGAPPAADPGFSVVDFSELIFWICSMGFGVWEGLEWIGNGCGIQMDGFSVQTEPYESVFDGFHDFDDFGVVFGGLTLLPEGPRTLRECPEGPGTL